MIWLALLLTAAFFSLRVLADSLVPELRRLVRRFNPIVLVVATLCGALSFVVIVLRVMWVSQSFSAKCELEAFPKG